LNQASGLLGPHDLTVPPNQPTNQPTTYHTTPHHSLPPSFTPSLPPSLPPSLTSPASIVVRATRTLTQFPWFRYRYVRSRAAKIRFPTCRLFVRSCVCLFVWWGCVSVCVTVCVCGCFVFFFGGGDSLPHLLFSCLFGIVCVCVCMCVWLVCLVGGWGWGCGKGWEEEEEGR
jgi:hypothetical protein